ncbi:MAG: hypothetical protein U1F49_19155 [Rubrivivax sp.]
MTLADTATHPPRLTAHVLSACALPRRIENFNDALLGTLGQRPRRGALDPRRERVAAGEGQRAAGRAVRKAAASEAAGDPVQSRARLLPLGFDEKNAKRSKEAKSPKKWPLPPHPRRLAQLGDVALPLERAGLAAQGYVVAMVNYHGSAGLRPRLPRQASRTAGANSNC